MKTIGIDLGTTKVAVVLAEDGKLIAAESAAHNARVVLENPRAAEQNVAEIFDCVKKLLSCFPADLRCKVQAVGITGQMHSVMLTDRCGNFSHLMTWQDHRCGKDRLEQFNQCSGLNLREGFGGTTLARLAQQGDLQQYTSAATISDMLGAYLCRNPRIHTDPTHAASWGLWDHLKANWNFDALKRLNIDPEILPEVLPSGAVIGHISPDRGGEFGIPANIPVINGIGDNQASILGSGHDLEREVFLTLGTGAQLSAVVSGDFPLCSDILELRPFPGDKALLVAAPMCGGSAFALLADTVNRFRQDLLGEEPLPRGELLDKLDAAAVDFLTRYGEPSIQIKPHFCGERYQADLRGCIEGLTLTNTAPGELAAALATGIVRNLKKDFPTEVFNGRTRIVGSGNAVRLLKSIQMVIRQEFPLELEFSEAKEEAAVGAARLACKNGG